MGPKRGSLPCDVQVETCLQASSSQPGQAMRVGHLAGHFWGSRGRARALRLGNGPRARPAVAAAPSAPGAGPGSGEAGTRPVAAASGRAAGAGRLPAGGAGASRALQSPALGRWGPGRSGDRVRGLGRAAQPSVAAARARVSLQSPRPPPVTPAPSPPAPILRTGGPQACHSAKTQFTQHAAHTRAHTYTHTDT